MIKLPGAQAKHMLNIVQMQEGEHKLVFTRVIFVSLYPRLIRIVRIEKELR